MDSTLKNLLVLVVDASDRFFQSSTSGDPNQCLSLSKCLDDSMTFLNAYLLLSLHNSVAVCLCHQAGSAMVYPLPDQREISQDSELLKTGKYEPLAVMNAAVSEGIRETMSMVSVQPHYDLAKSSLLSGALSKSLCYIHRRKRELPVGQQLKGRILVVRTSSDMATQYVSMMNCIFAAEKHGIPIDSCVLWEDSGFLQQASDLTGGIYIKVPEPAGLVQFMLWTFLPDASSCRQFLALPPVVQVDYRAACMCHQRLVNVAYVCSVCLSVFCQFNPICALCQTHFKLPTNIAKGKKKKTQPGTTGPDVAAS
ncbi:hypothetical protein EMCRGX_G024959 [Ephydatia muelleri]|eukprot:Em0015g1085a